MTSYGALKTKVIPDPESNLKWFSQIREPESWITLLDRIQILVYRNLGGLQVLPTLADRGYRIVRLPIFALLLLPNTARLLRAIVRSCDNSLNIASSVPLFLPALARCLENQRCDPGQLIGV